MPMWSRVKWWTLNLQRTYNDCTWVHLLSFTEVAYGWNFVFWSKHFSWQASSYKFYQLESTYITIAMHVSEVKTKLLSEHLLKVAGISAHVCLETFSVNLEKGAEAGHHLLEAWSSIGCNLIICWVSAQIGQPRTWSLYDRLRSFNKVKVRSDKIAVMNFWLQCLNTSPLWRSDLASGINVKIRCLMCLLELIWHLLNENCRLRRWFVQGSRNLHNVLETAEFDALLQTCKRPSLLGIWIDFDAKVEASI